MQEIKKSSNDFVSEKKFTSYKFAWQEGYGAFSYSHSSVDNVIGYIQNQKQHHQKQTFRDEYIDFPEKFDIDFKDDFLFQWISLFITFVGLSFAIRYGIIFDEDELVPDLFVKTTLNPFIRKFAK